MTRRETHSYRRFPTMIRPGNLSKPHYKGRNVEDDQREGPIFTPILRWDLLTAAAAVPGRLAAKKAR